LSIVQSSPVIVYTTWTDVPFDAANFSGTGGQTWTVTSDNVKTFCYIVQGKLMVVSFGIFFSSLSGTPSPELRITIPDGRVASRTMINAMSTRDSTTGDYELGWILASVGKPYLSLFRSDIEANWANGTNDGRYFGEITFAIE
jgi:hypothetical protein